jgi:probable HAF family extracellular repeat protein
MRHANGRTESLGLPDGFTHGHAQALNAGGDVVGVLYGPTEGTAFTCFDGVIKALDIAGAAQHEACGVNRLRQVCGSLRGEGNGEPGRPFVWQDGKLSLLHWPGRRSAVAQATALNDEGTVVGIAYRQGQNGWVERAFVAFDGVMFDMNTLLEADQAHWVLYRAAAINERGQIVGRAWREDLQAYRGYLATPVA